MPFAVIPEHMLADPRLGPGCKAIFAALTVLAIEGRTVAAVAAIADTAGMPERTARGHLLTLAHCGLIHTRPTYAGAGRQGPNAYTVHAGVWELDTYEALTYGENWGEPGWQETAPQRTDNPAVLLQEPDSSPTGIGRGKKTILQPLMRDKTVYEGWQKIAPLYAAALPDLPQPQMPLGKTIEAAARARWKEHPTEEWWRDYFARVAAAPWLTGKKAGADGSTFRATLAWLLGPKNLDKVLAGNYDAAPTAAARQQAKPADNAGTWNLTTEQWREHAELEAKWTAESPAASQRFLASRGSAPFLDELRHWQATGKRPNPADRTT